MHVSSAASRIEILPAKGFHLWGIEAEKKGV
jgi:hypothetical protein